MLLNRYTVWTSREFLDTLDAADPADRVALIAEYAAGAFAAGEAEGFDKGWNVRRSHEAA